MQIAGPTVSYAALPHLARQYHRGEPLEPTMCKAIAYLSVCGWPPLIATAIYSREVVQFLYGSQWVECAPLVALFCAIACIAITAQFHGSALQAIGRPFMAIVPQAASLIARVACIVAFYDGSLISFGWCLVLASVVTIPVYVYMQIRYFRLGNRAFLASLLPSLSVTLACGLTVMALHALTPAGWPVFFQLLALAGILVPVWLCAVLFVHHPFVSELQRIGERFPPLGRALQFIMRLRR